MIKNKKAIIFDWWNTLWHPKTHDIDSRIQLFLKLLYKQDYMLGIISNTPDDTGGSGRYIRKKLHEIELLSIFEFVIASGTIGIHKPDPRIFQMGMNFFPFEAKDVLMVGDSDSCDGGSIKLGIEYFKVNLTKGIWVDNLRNKLFPFFL
jgi:FMN phosphatase YigB (HAD superfamily)